MKRTFSLANVRRILALTVLLLGGAATVSFGQSRDQVPPAGGLEPKWIPLFTAAGAERSGGDAMAPQASRYRAVTVNPLLTDETGVAVGDRIFIAAFDGGAALGLVDRVRTDVNGVFAVRARIAGPDGYLLLSSDREGRSLGRLVLPDRREFEISCVDGGPIHIIEEFAPGARAALPGGEPLVPPASSDAGPAVSPLVPPAAAAANTRIDCLIAYTPSARDYANSGSGINNFVSQAMSLAQLGMDNSGVEITMRLAYSALVNYTESGSSNTDLNRLTNTSDGYMDEIHSWRNTYGADLVHLFTNVEDTGGLGWLLSTEAGSAAYAFCLGRIKQVSWTTTTVHEWGHNMGCHHRKDQATQPGPGLYSYSAGWRWIGNDGNKYCSIMSYQDSYGGVTPAQVEYFSNPSVNYKGTPTGHSADGDNARTLRNIKAVIANYRSEAGTFRLTLSSSAGGNTAPPSPGVHTYASGTVVRLTASPSEGYEFKSWSGGINSTQNPYNLTMDRDWTIYCAFQRIIYAPMNAAGEKVLNRSLALGQYINVITFAANPANANILSYKIYQVENGQRTEVASLDATGSVYWHRDVEKDKEYTYHIVAVNSEPREGAAAVVVIR